jgi:hypothetical protein
VHNVLNAVITPNLGRFSARVGLEAASARGSSDICDCHDQVPLRVLCFVRVYQMGL